MPNEILAEPVDRLGFSYIVKRLGDHMFYAQAHYPNHMCIIFKPSKNADHINFLIEGAFYEISFVSKSILEEMKEELNVD